MLVRVLCVRAPAQSCAALNALIALMIYYYYGCFNVGLGRRPVCGRRRTRIRSDIVKMTRPRAEVFR